MRSGKHDPLAADIGFTFPLLIPGIAEVCEWFEERDGRFHIEVNVANQVWVPVGSSIRLPSLF